MKDALAGERKGMKNNVDKFPVSTWQRNWNRRGKRAVNCVVSDRYLVFGHAGKPSRNYLPDHSQATPADVDVMTHVDWDNEPRKLCSLVLTLEEMENMVEMLESEQN